MKLKMAVKLQPSSKILKTVVYIKINLNNLVIGIDEMGEDSEIHSDEEDKERP